MATVFWDHEMFYLCNSWTMDHGQLWSDCRMLRNLSRVIQTFWWISDGTCSLVAMFYSITMCSLHHCHQIQITVNLYCENANGTFSTILPTVWTYHLLSGLLSVFAHKKLSAITEVCIKLAANFIKEGIKNLISSLRKVLK